MRVNVWIPDKLLFDLDEHCKKNKITRSSYLKEVLISGLQAKEGAMVKPSLKERKKVYSKIAGKWI